MRFIGGNLSDNLGGRLSAQELNKAKPTVGDSGRKEKHRRDTCATAGWGSQTVTTFNPIVFAASH
jgi:hypothetical protein